MYKLYFPLWQVFRFLQLCYWGFHQSSPILVSSVIYLFIQFDFLILQLISNFGYLFQSSVSFWLTVLSAVLFLCGGRGEFEKCVHVRVFCLHVVACTWYTWLDTTHFIVLLVSRRKRLNPHLKHDLYSLSKALATCFRLNQSSGPCRRQIAGIM
jgi:hypothetical protein